MQIFLLTKRQRQRLSKNKQNTVPTILKPRKYNCYLLYKIENYKIL